MTQAGGSRRILILDDDAAHTQVLCDTLRSEGYETVRVTSAVAALAALRDSNFDFVLTTRQAPLTSATLERQLLERTAELEAANKELQGFAYAVSHDLRAPLRAIDGYLRMIEEDLGDKLDGVGKRLLDVVCSSSRKMSTMIDGLLAYSRVGRQPLQTGEINMTALASEVWAEINVGLPGTHEFTLTALPAAFGDVTLLRQVWMHLLSNAIKYSGKTDTTSIEVSSQVAGDEVIYAVKDNGAGFDMRYYDKLFEVFQRLHSESEFAGIGIGLAIVQKVVTRHGGRVWAEGETGKGARFFFSLPQRDA